jgi:predicted AAA+ superfamily ATPase
LGGFSKYAQNWWFSTTFGGFFEKPSKVVVFHHFSRFFQKTVKTGGFPPLLAVFSKNRQKWWFSTTFHGFFKKPSKLVGFHRFCTVKTTGAS